MPKLTDQQATFLARHMGYRPLSDEEEAAATPPPVTAEENDRLERLLPDELVKTDLTQGDPKALFSGAYMERLKDVPIKGVGEPRLKDLMREIEKGVAGPRRAEVMEDLSSIVGSPPTASALDVDYGRFLVVRKQQKAIGIGKDDQTATLDEDKHPDFLASRGQLLFGKVLGDAFGIHEVFASLLNPTGGLVGPGNWLIPGVVEAGHLDPDNPVALHGCVHDAAGYLLTFHNQGPGYNYLDSDLELLGTDSPLSGQVSGIAYWVAEAGDDYLIRRVDAAVVAVEKALKSARDVVAKGIDGLLGVFRRKKDEAVEAVDQAQEEVLDVVHAIEDGLDKAAQSAVEAVETSTASLDRVMRDKAKDKLKAVQAFIWD